MLKEKSSLPTTITNKILYGKFVVFLYKITRRTTILITQRTEKKYRLATINF